MAHEMTREELIEALANREEQAEAWRRPSANRVELAAFTLFLRQKKRRAPATFVADRIAFEEDVRAVLDSLAGSVELQRPDPE